MIKNKNPEYTPTPLEIAEEQLAARELHLRGWMDPEQEISEFSERQIASLSKEIGELKLVISNLKE
jgi:hypothetical protein